MGLKPEEVYFENTEHQKLHAWWFSAVNLKPVEQTKGTIVFFHGNAQNLTSHFMALA